MEHTGNLIEFDSIRSRKEFFRWETLAHKERPSYRGSELGDKDPIPRAFVSHNHTVSACISWSSSAKPRALSKYASQISPQGDKRSGHLDKAKTRLCSFTIATSRRPLQLAQTAVNKCFSCEPFSGSPIRQAGTHGQRQIYMKEQGEYWHR